MREWNPVRYLHMHNPSNGLIIQYRSFFRRELTANIKPPIHHLCWISKVKSVTPPVRSTKHFVLPNGTPPASQYLGCGWNFVRGIVQLTPLMGLNSQTCSFVRREPTANLNFLVENNLINQFYFNLQLLHPLTLHRQ